MSVKENNIGIISPLLSANALCLYLTPVSHYSVVNFPGKELFITLMNIFIGLNGYSNTIFYILLFTRYYLYIVVHYLLLYLHEIICKFFNGLIILKEFVISVEYIKVYPFCANIFAHFF